MINTIKTMLAAAFRCILWGSAFPMIKIGYKYWNISGSNTPQGHILWGVSIHIQSNPSIWFLNSSTVIPALFAPSSRDKTLSFTKSTNIRIFSFLPCSESLEQQYIGQRILSGPCGMVSFGCRCLSSHNVATQAA